MSRMLNLSTCLMLRTVESTALTRCDGVPQVTTQNVACGVEGTSCSRKLEITYAGRDHQADPWTGDTGGQQDLPR